MADFDTIFEMVIPHEGFYSNVKGDTGKETYMGISRKHNPNWDGWKIIDRYKVNGPIPHDFRIPNQHLEDLAEELYLCQYWIKIKGSKIKCNAIAANLFDMYINAGKNAIVLMQKAVQELGTHVEIDGIIGPKTIEAINSLPAKRLNDLYNNQRRKYYLEIAKNGDNIKFLKGWLKRVDQFENMV